MRLEDVLRQQDGFVGRAQARACGVSPRALRGRVARGQLQELLPGIYLATGHRCGDAGRVRAVSLWGGEDAVLDGPAAAFWLELLDHPSGPVGLTVPHAVRRVAPPGVRVRRRDIDPVDKSRHEDVALTGLALTVLETAPAIPDGAAFLDRSLQRHVSFAELHAAYCRMLGATGTARIRPLLVGAADRADSRAERRLVTLLRHAGIDGFVRGLPFGPWEIDIAFPAERVAIEFDGWAFHTDPQRFQNDRSKGNALVAGGWSLLRFTWRDITERPAAVLAQIRHALQPSP